MLMNTLLSKSRYLILMAVVGTLVGMIALMVFGLWEIYDILVLTVVSHDQKDIGKQLTFAFIEVIDTFLIATVCYITALGLYELFIDDALELPAWLNITSLDDLKNKLTSVIVVVLGVVFLGKIVSWDGSSDILNIGASIALVIAALTWFLRQSSTKGH